MTTDFWDQFVDIREPSQPTEEDQVSAIVQRLRRHFRIWHRPQLQGRLCDGRRVRADLVLAPYSNWGGRNGSSLRPFILEVKRFNGIGDITKAIGQAADYAHATWDTCRLTDAGWIDVPDDGRMMACVAWHSSAWEGERQGRQWVDRIAGRLNVMVLNIDDWEGWSITNSGNEQWSERRGMANTAFNAVPKAGAR